MGNSCLPGLSLVISLMGLFVLSFLPLDVLDEILDLIVSVSECFPIYSSAKPVRQGVGTVAPFITAYEQAQ